MTDREVIKLLKANGWKMEEGAKHALAVKGSHKIPIPRHKGDIPAGTLHRILKDAGLK